MPLLSSQARAFLSLPALQQTGPAKDGWLRAGVGRLLNVACGPWRECPMGLLDRLVGGGGRDGSSPEKAVVVGGVGEEYAWMRRHCPGFRPEQQSLQEIAGKPYDVLTWRNERGEERTVYFDISGFFGR